MPSPVKVNVIRGLVVPALLLVLLVQPCLAQTPREPEREQLLNGLRLLVWSQPNSPELLVKLRLNSGAAFDLASIRSGFVANLKVAAPATGTPAAALLANLENTSDKMAHEARVAQFGAACNGLGSKALLQNVLAIVSLNREKARQLPIIEFPETMPVDNQTVDPNARLHPSTCQLVNEFVP